MNQIVQLYIKPECFSVAQAVKHTKSQNVGKGHAIIQQRFTIGVAAINLKKDFWNKALFLLIIPLQKNNNNY